MKSFFKFILAALAATAALASCTKQDDSPVKSFTAIIEQAQTKTTLDGDVVKWSNGDQVNINGAVYSVEPSIEKPDYAKLAYIRGSVPTAPYIAVYPASLYDLETGKYFLPREQEYEAGRFNAPMIAMSSDENLAFSNVCGVLRFALTGTGKVAEIEIDSESLPLSGQFKVNGGSTEMQEQEGFNWIKLDCGRGVELSPTAPAILYVYLPAGTYPAGDLTVVVRNPDEWQYKKPTVEDAVVQSNHIYTFDWEVTFSEPGEDDHDGH